MAEALVPRFPVDVLGRPAPIPYRVGWIGHSQVGWASLDPGFQPIEGVKVDLFRRSGAKAMEFFETPELVAALDEPLDMAIVWLGGNDLNPNTDLVALKQQCTRIMNAFLERGVTTYFMTVEPRKYPQSSKHFVDPQIYTKLRNGLDHYMKRKHPGKIIITGGLTITEDLLAIDGVHVIREGRVRVQNKIVNLIQTHYVKWWNKNYPHLPPK